MAANYSAVEALRDGRRVEIRAFKPSDRTDLESALARTSSQSLYRRFFTVKRSFSEREQEFFLSVDFVDHVALMAWAEEPTGSVIVGGGRYVVVQPGTAGLPAAIVEVLLRSRSVVDFRVVLGEGAEGPGTATAGDCHRKGPARQAGLF
jgi:hypothetical protein